MTETVSLVLQSIILLHSWEKESPQHTVWPVTDSSSFFQLVLLLLWPFLSAEISIIDCVCFSTMVGGVFFLISHMALSQWVHSLSYLRGLLPLSKSPRGELKLGRKTQWPSNVNAWQFIQLWKTSISYKSVVQILSLHLSISDSLSPSYCQSPFCEPIPSLFSFFPHYHLPNSLSTCISFFLRT